MNEQDRLKVNKLAARFIGLIYECDYFDGAVLVKETRVSVRSVFDIFSIAGDCLAVVQKLGESCGTSIARGYSCDGDFDSWFWGAFNADKDVWVGKFDTYEDATAMAVMEVME